MLVRDEEGRSVETVQYLQDEQMGKSMHKLRNSVAARSRFGRSRALRSTEAGEYYHKAMKLERVQIEDSTVARQQQVG